ncbi:MAG: sugar transferase [Deltaproteobacteria bacterium]|nr:sugar transferase [Deltaproteobacteria bacterium]
MKAVILPTGDPDRLKPLDEWMPEFLLPIVNKPLVEHLIELLIRHSVKDIILVLKHLPYETEQYFGKGERWGCSISYSLAKGYRGILNALARIQSRLGESFLCLPGNVVTNVNLTDLIRAHEKVKGDVTMALRTENKWKTEPIDPPLKPTFHPFIMTTRALSNLLASSLAQNLEQMIASLAMRGLNIYGHYSLFEHRAIDSLADYLEINRSVLKGGCRGMIIPGNQLMEGVWVGRQSRIDPQARISPPLLIGDYCQIHDGAVVGKEAVIGNNVILSQCVSMQGSVILDNTYIGAHTEIRDSIVRKNILIDIPRSLNLYVGDDFILGDLEKDAMAKKGLRIFNSILALFFLLLFSPIILPLFLFHLMFPSKKIFSSDVRYGEYVIVDHHGAKKPKSFHLYSFKSKHGFIHKLPSLMNVIKGDMALVGNSPLTQLEAFSLREQWETVRFNAPAGIFHLWEIDGTAAPTWEEKLVTENYYASTRSFKGDLRILLKSLTPF